MVINPTYLAQRTRSSVNWTDAKKRVIHSYRDWLRSILDVYAEQLERDEGTREMRSQEPGLTMIMQAPEIQTMYSLNMPVSTLRTKMRQEFERHRYVNQLKTVDVLLFNSHQEFQETLNFWKQLSHVLKYFRAEEDPKARLPNNFIHGFLEVRSCLI
ncbi:hypothetical protein GT037_007787 [Alternaria burnsii]|uniref:Uncharacterized protein n=1 Tax=Alternaria burnsii TaxID=1187904 RepID=A0A8H7B0H1_9PLEO|nr:uncharacterized protein GT037_007787 [Alternaria burnsii]KAF7674021.1 hypothetical protein GT037_007787 [Alternaria burnsii]